jgi:tRNA (guanine37-N1)-methyltransferase
VGGNHGEIAAWRRRKAIERTLHRRPDLVENRAFSDEERREIENILKEIK